MLVEVDEDREIKGVLCGSGEKAGKEVKKVVTIASQELDKRSGIFELTPGKRVAEADWRFDVAVRGGKTLLLVDDEEAIRQIGQELLEDMGYEVLLAKNGKEAVDLYRKNKDNIDIVLLDIMMPIMGGGEAYDRLRAINPNVKVLLWSGANVNDQATEMLGRGCCGFIQKPFSIEQLSRIIREILDKA